MASTITQAASSSYSLPQWTYDVFLSFRGKDTRNTFTGHLYASLKQRGIDVYMDDRELERGKPIEPALWKAIEESRFSVIVFSKGYASSPWCLDELVKIVQCMKEMGHTVFPVFYDVDPSEVAEQQKGNYKKAFVRHENKSREEEFREELTTNLEKPQCWKDCLAIVGCLSGWDVRDRNESEMIKKIVEHIEYKLSISLPTISQKLVGMDFHLEVLNGYINAEPSDSLFIGICGMGGIGKTTIARVIYDKIRWKFEGSSFLANVKDFFLEKNGPCRLQGQLLSEILMECTTVRDSSRGIDLIKRRLRFKKVLLILDDVDEQEELQMLAAEHKWFGLGSRIIITSRNKNVLVMHGANRIYEAKELNDDDALMLFSWKAFKDDKPANDFKELSKQVVGYANGLPLALEVIGSFLRGRSMVEWGSAINRMNEIPDRRIIQVLRISFDGLHELEKKIFLDISCFLKGMKRDRIIRILDGCGFHANIGIQVLVEKSLISVSWDEVWMHNLLQAMGKEIVRCESPEEPARRSRLWAYEDVSLALSDINKEKENIESIFLDSLGTEEAQWNMKSFSKMNKLRLLKIQNVQLPEGPEYLSNELRFLEWHAYPSKFLPACFKPNKLVELDMSYSSIQQLWGFESSVNLKIINLSHSLNLTETPDFTGMPNLERLILEGCKSLSKVHSSLGFHKKLQHVNLVNCISLRSLPSNLEMESLRIFTLDGCWKLEKFPDIRGNMKCLMELYLDGTSIAELPSSICHLVGLVLLSMNNCMKLERIPNALSGLKSLKKLDLSGCSKLVNLPKDLDKVEFLEELLLSETSIRQPPASIFLLKNLKTLSFDGCKRMVVNPMYQMVPSLSDLYTLEVLNLCSCNLVEGAVPEDIGLLSSLKSLDLSKNNFVSLPKSINKLSGLEVLVLEDCRMLQSLPAVPSKVQTVNLNGCVRLTKVPDPEKLCSLEISWFQCLNCWELYKHNAHRIMGLSMLQRYLKGSSHKSGFGITVPGSKIPGWFSHQSERSSISVHVPPKFDDDNCEWVGFALCVAFSGYDDSPGLFCHLKTVGREDYPLPVYICYKSSQVLSDHLWLLYLSFDYLKGIEEWKHESFSNTELSFHFYEQGVKVKNCGVCLVFAPSIKSSTPRYGARFSMRIKKKAAHLVVATKHKETASSSIASFSFSSYFCEWMRNVFFCFGIEDSSNNFISCLYTALVQRGIICDGINIEIEREKEIEPRLSKAIEESRLSIIIFTGYSYLKRSYDYEPWCIDKLLDSIQYANDNLKDADFPVAYDIEAMNLGELDEEKNNYKIVFDKHRDDFDEKRVKVDMWRNILDRLFFPFLSMPNGPIFLPLRHELETICEDLVGIDSFLRRLDQLTESSTDTIILGICGMDCINKTTIARVIFDKIRLQYQGSCYLEHVREVFVEQDGPRRLQERLLSEILKERVVVWDSSSGIDLMKQSLKLKKVLLILDDVDAQKQVEMLAAKRDWFGRGSLIIMTSGNQNVFRECGGIVTYNIEKLNNDDALMLFSWKAFKKDQPPEEFRELSHRVLGYANGLPLTLEVIGSFLGGRSIMQWENAICRLNEIPKGKIIDTLRISFDGLNVLEKKIFLDIACFFKGMETERIIRILDRCGFHANFLIQVLRNKSLISFTKAGVSMQKLLQVMGKEIVYCESPQEPERRSRLFTYEDVCIALKDANKEKEKIESIFLDLPRTEEAQWNMKAFSKMSKLRLLKIHNVQLSEGPEYLSNELRFLEWHAYPSNSLPACFKPDELVELHMSYSSIHRLWYGFKSLLNLKIINLSHSLNLIGTPDFTGIPNLETLNLEGCTSLSKIHPSLGHHKNLQHVNLVNCANLRSLPCNLEMESLRVFSLDGCWKLEKFPDIEGNMRCLMELHLDGTNIAELPSSIHHLFGLVLLSMNNCMKLERIPDTITCLQSLKKLHLSGCSKLLNLPEDLSKVECLEELLLSETSMRQPPASIFLLENLKTLSFDRCKRMAVNFMHQLTLSNLCSLEVLNLSACDLGEGAIPEDIGFLSSLRVLDLSRNNFTSLPKTINRLSRLEILDLEACRMLKSLPEVPSKVQKLNLNCCISLKQVPDPRKLCSLETSSFECLNCWELCKHNGHESLGLTMLKRYLQGPYAVRSGFAIAVPGSKIPRWFSHQRKGCSINVHVPPRLDVDNGGWIGFSACVAFKAYDESPSLSCYFQANGKEYHPLPMCICCDSIQVMSDHLWFFYLSFDYLKEFKEWSFESSSTIELLLHFEGQGMEVVNCGVCLVYSPAICSPVASFSAHLVVATKDTEAAASATASVSFSSYFWQWMRSVSLSFRVEDASNNFTSYLYKALVQRGIIREEWELEREKAIEPRLLKAIEDSRCSIIIFTRDHDDTPWWCIDKLLHFIQYTNDDVKDADFPVSYDIEPLNLDEQEGSCTIIFDKDQDDSMKKREKDERWINILTKLTYSFLDARRRLEMSGEYDPFWDYVDRTDNGLKCKFCELEFEVYTSIRKIRYHFSRIGGHGVEVCKKVPLLLTSSQHGRDKKLHIMPSSSNPVVRENRATKSKIRKILEHSIGGPRY